MPSVLPIASEEAHAIMRELLRQFPVDFPAAMELGVARTLAIPDINAIFLRTGEYLRRGTSRQSAALTAVFELILNGSEATGSRCLIESLNRIHQHHQVPPDFLLHAVSGLVSGPLRWIDRFSWRCLTEREREGVASFWHQVATLMQLPGPPRDGAGWLAWQANFEARHQYSHPANTRMAEMMREVFASRAPRYARPLSRTIYRCLLDEDLHPHLGWNRPGLLARGLILGSCRIRRWLMRVFPFSRGLGKFTLADLSSAR